MNTLPLPQHINLEEAIALANEDLQIDNIAQYKDTIAQWAFEAIRDIHSLKSSLPRTATLTLHEFRARLPKDFYALDDAGGDCLYAEETPYLGNDCEQDGIARVDIRGCHLHSNLQSGTIKINYKAIPTDAVGYPLIPLSHEKAVAYYITHRWLRPRFLSGKLPLYVYEQTKREWEDQCARARGKDNIPSPARARLVGRIRKSLI